MNKQKMTPIGIVLAVLVLLLVAFMVRSSLKRPEHIVLPQESAGEVAAPDKSGNIHTAAIRPDTVQSAISVLKRAASYSRVVTVERFWNGGSAVTETTVNVADGWTKLTTLQPGGELRSTVFTDDGQVYIWYGAERRCYHGTAALSQDTEQGIPTYEEILLLPTDQIRTADYRTLDSVPCIYVETAPDADGYVQRYWVSTENGLLYAAERESGGTLVYTMRAEESDDTVTAGNFTLPDGTALFDPQKAD